VAGPAALLWHDHVVLVSSRQAKKQQMCPKSEALLRRKFLAGAVAACGATMLTGASAALAQGKTM